MRTILLLSAAALAKVQPFCLSTLIIPGEKVGDGLLVEAINIPWISIVRELNQKPDFLRTMDPRRFEELIAASYKQAGFDEVILTPQSGDFGRDVIAIKRGFVTVRVLDQAKRYAPDNLVGANDIRALIGVLQSDHSATNAVLTTTSDFAPKVKDDPFIKPYLPNRLQLINGADLVARLSGLV